MSIRDERATAIRKRIGNGLADDIGLYLPLLLDDLDAIGDTQPELAEALADAAELHAECDSLAGLLVEAAAERDRLRELLNESSIADPVEGAGALAEAAGQTPKRPAPRRRTRT